ncbi:tagaturonate reductase [Parabacteroides sp. OttesenSCG-928-G21]|nr:tagaturonate reductase [Parabacteroides sp. OttesenSCG-928-G21]
MKELNGQNALKRAYPERVIQFGEGNFLRAFADWIIQKMNDNAGFDGSVVIVQPIKDGLAEEINQQDCLYHVNLLGLEEGKEVNTLDLIDIVSRALNPYENYADYLRLAEQPEIRFILSNTTEAGIVFDPNCRLTDHPASSFPGKLTQLLFHRYRKFKGALDKGLLIFPCELIFRNGDVLRETICQYIDHWDLGDEFKKWFTESCGVYSTLVDRIVPGFPRKNIAAIQERLQYEDRLVVQAEVFYLWIIEAPQAIEEEFPVGKAGLNVFFVADEEPYHKRKVTLLNGAHTVLAPVAWLSGIDIVRDACRHEIVGQYIRKVMFDELIPTLDLAREELNSYANEVLERFNNPYIDHSVTSIMLNSFSKYRTRDLPALERYTELTGELPNGLIMGLAALITWNKGDQRADGMQSDPNDDPEIVRLVQGLWATGSIHAVAEGVLEAEFIWGKNLNRIPGLTDKLICSLVAIQEKGMLNAIKDIC